MIFGKEVEETVFGLYHYGRLVACSFITHLPYLKNELRIANEVMPEMEEGSAVFITCLASIEKGMGEVILDMLQTRFDVDLILEAVSSNTRKLKNNFYYRVGFEEFISGTDYLIRKKDL